MSSRQRGTVELLLTMPNRSTDTLRTNIRGQLLEAMATGRLPAGSRLPSTRQLADDLGVARGTVVEVYDQLVHEGYLTTGHGAGTAVAEPTPEPRHAAGDTTTSPRLVDLRPGRPNLRSFPREIWAKAASHVLRTLPDAELGESHPVGASVLRTELATHLRRTRHLITDPDRMAVTTGIEHGLALLCQILRAHGHDLLAVEDPTDPTRRQILIDQEMAVADVPVDAEGISVEELRRTGVRAVLVTHTPQYPTGTVMTPRRRQALVAWAADVGAVVVEVDDGFHLRRLSAPSLQAALPGLAVHISSVSQTLVPGTRLGWLAVPKTLQPQLASAAARVGFPTGIFDQHTFAHLLKTGEYDRHIRRQRSVYQTQRTAFVNALAVHLPDWSVRGSDAGLHLWLEPHQPCDGRRLKQAAELHGLRVMTMADMSRSGDNRGLVLSFAQLSAHAADDTARALADAVAMSKTVACSDHSPPDHRALADASRSSQPGFP